jgi:uncharacterized protein
MEKSDDYIASEPVSVVEARNQPMGCILMIVTIFVSLLAGLFSFVFWEGDTAIAIFSTAIYLIFGVAVVKIASSARIDLKKMTGSIERLKAHRAMALWVFPLIVASMFTAWLMLSTMAVIDESWFYSYVEYSSEMFSMIEDAAGIELLLILISIVILAPVVEEYVFRGLLLSNWSAKWGNTKAVLFSSIIFGILHMDPFGAFLMGMVLCLIYLKTGSLLLVILIHFLNNGLAMVLSFTAPGLIDWSTVGLLFRYSWIYITSGLIALAFLIPFIKTIWPSGNELPPYLREDGSNIPAGVANDAGDAHDANVAKVANVTSDASDDNYGGEDGDNNDGGDAGDGWRR